MADSNILVVDDDPDLRETLCELLEEEGFRATPASNGKEAIERIKRSPPPQLVLLDLMMPVMNGWQFLEERERDPVLGAIPVVVMTANPNPGMLAGKANLVMHKPLKLEDLLATVAKYVD